MSNTKKDKVERLKKFLDGEITISQLKPRMEQIMIGGRMIEFENSVSDQCMIINGKVFYF